MHFTHKYALCTFNGYVLNANTAFNWKNLRMGTQHFTNLQVLIETRDVFMCVGDSSFAKSKPFKRALFLY